MDTRTDAESLDLKFLKMMDHLTNSASRPQNTGNYDTHTWTDNMYQLEDGCTGIEDFVKDIQQLSDQKTKRLFARTANETLISMIKLLTELGLQIEAQEGRLDPRKKLLMIFGRLEGVGGEVKEIMSLASVEGSGEGSSGKASAEAK